ncbi:MAG: phenylalanine--tRNA ligase subunit beta, partial [Candidatus Magasanikbacteria bacterium]|nr:phenylalanine--tRNA ligase subunit beta [Candidatus Magasanikbacteria bacterium]
SQRDVAFTVAKSVAHNDIVQTVSSCSDLITSVELFDVYEGENLEEGQKSMAYHVVYGLGDRTLKNEEVSEAHKHVVSMLSEQYDATVRK